MVDPSTDILVSWNANSDYAALLQDLNATTGKTSRVFTASLDFSANGGKAHIKPCFPSCMTCSCCCDICQCRLSDGRIRRPGVQRGEPSIAIVCACSLIYVIRPLACSSSTTLAATSLIGWCTTPSTRAPTPASSCRSRTGPAIICWALHKLRTVCDIRNEQNAFLAVALLHVHLTA